MKKVSVIILNWNGISYIEACLRSLEAQTYRDFEVVVVDNGSTDGSPDFIRQHFPYTQLITLSTNTGFAVGNNVAISRTHSDYVATVNNDIILDENWLKTMVRSLSNDERYGMVASKILLLPDNHLVDSTGIQIDGAGMAWNRDYGRRAEEVLASAGEVFGPCAAAALYSREMLNDVGLFDEDYFAFYEDVDLAWRARLRGWRCLYAGEALAFHHHSASAKRNPQFKTFLIARNKLWTIIKNYPMPQLLINLPIIAFYELVPCLYYLVRHGDISRLRGKVSALSRLGQTLNKRKQIQSAKNLKNEEFAKLLVPARNPFYMSPN